MRSFAAIFLSIIAGACAYDWLSLRMMATGNVIGWDESLGLLAPALLIALLFATFVLMPLWFLVAKDGSTRRRLFFVVVSTAVWLAGCTALFAAGVVHASADLENAIPLLVPGLVLVTLFGWSIEAPGAESAGAPRAERSPPANSAAAGAA